MDKDLPLAWLGTYRLTNQEHLRRVISAALSLGSVGFDTAPSYGTIGPLAQELATSGVERAAYKVSSKVDAWQMQESALGGRSVEWFVEESLRTTSLGHFDVLYVHWPVEPYLDHAIDRLLTLRDRGLIGQVGLSNVSVRHVKRLHDDGFVPAIIQQEIHPLNTEVDVTSWCERHGTEVVAYTPTARLVPAVSASPTLKALAAKYGRTITQVCLRWHRQRGRSYAFMTTRPERVAENVVLDGFDLTEEECSLIDAMDCGLTMFVRSQGSPGW